LIGFQHSHTSGLKALAQKGQTASLGAKVLAGF